MQTDIDPKDLEIAIKRLQKDIEILSKIPSKDFPIQSLQAAVEWLRTRPEAKKEAKC